MKCLRKKVYICYDSHLNDETVRNLLISADKSIARFLVSVEELQLPM